ncbi:MAG: flagellar basal body-associated FliL family protein [Geminicoccaceae bacterium]
MKLPLPVLLVAFGLIAGGGAGSYWYIAHAAPASPATPIQDESRAFIDMDRKFVVPLVKGNRVWSLVVADLRLEVKGKAEQRALDLKPRLRDALLDTLYAMAVAGAFDGDLYSNNVQGEMRDRLLHAAKRVLQEDATAVLIAELLRQDS